MSAKTTGMIWDADLKVPQRMVLLAMVDHADHDGEHIHAPIAFIAWKTGYSDRNVSRIIQGLLGSGVLVLTGASVGEENEYRFDLSRAKMKRPYRGRKPDRRRSTPDKMSPPTHDKMSGVTAATHDKMSGVTAATHDKMSGVTPESGSTPDKMSPPTHDKLAIDHDLPYKKDHDSPPPPPPRVMVLVGGGGESIDQGTAKTDLYHWLRANGVDSPDAAERNQHHDRERTQAFYRRIVGDAIGEERKKRIGRFIRALDRDGPPPMPQIATIADYQPPAVLPADAPSRAETRAAFRAMRAKQQGSRND